jgi:DNA mismatch repair protein MSH2
VETLIVSPRAARDMAAAALFSAGKKVVLVSVNKDGSCSVRAEASPGNVEPLAECMDLDAAVDTMPARPLLDGGTVVAVKVSGVSGRAGSSGNVGVAAWDPAKKTMSMAELHDDEVFSALEGILVAVNAMEVLLCVGDLGDHEAGKMNAMLEECGVACTVLEKKKFADTHVGTDIERLVGSHLRVVRFLDMKLALPAAAALSSFLHLMEDDSNANATTVDALDHSSFMRLDTAALRALNVVPFTGDGGGGKRATLYGLLNRTKTPMGSRLMRRWLAQPLQDKIAIETRLDITEAFVSEGDLRGRVRDEHLRRMPDLHTLIARFTKNNAAKATLQDVVRLYQCSVRLVKLVELLDGSEAEIVEKRYRQPLSILVDALDNYNALVEKTIDLLQIANGEFVISPLVNADLGRLREAQDAIISDIADEHQKALRALRPQKDDALKLEKHETLGYVFRVTRKDERLIRDKPQYIVVDTRKDGVRFVTRGLKKLSTEYADVAKDYSIVETGLRTQTIAVAATHMESFTEVASTVAEMDVLLSFAEVAGVARGDAYIRPKILPAGNGLVLKQARHPMVEECLDGKDFIANDMDLRRNNGVDNTEQMSDEDAAQAGGALLLITGPNTGGKSTYIRTAGVLTLMAHVGCFVPAEEAVIPITDRILCRVGAGDNQHRAVSTFMSEMLETATILRSATINSLIIIDELGRGTGVSDGYGLAYAISHHITTKIRAQTLFATHFHELTSLATAVPSVRNLSVTALTDQSAEGITFLYEVKAGACGKSFGVHVAEMARFPPVVVAAAKRKLADLEGADGISDVVRKRTHALSEEQVAKGKTLMNGFLAQVRQLPLKTEGEQKASVAEVKRLRQELLEKKDPYIACLVRQA